MRINKSSSNKIEIIDVNPSYPQGRLKGGTGNKKDKIQLTSVNPSLTRNRLER